MIYNYVQYSAHNISFLAYLVQSLVSNGVKYDQHQRLYDLIFQHTQSLKESQVLDRQPFEKIILSFSEIGDIEKVQHLLSDIDPEHISVQAVLDLRNNILDRYPDRTDIMDALEMRAVTMLHKFGSKDAKITLSNRQTQIASREQERQAKRLARANQAKGATRTAMRMMK